MKVTVTIEDEVADIGGLVGSLADYFGNMKPSPWANVPLHVSTPNADVPPHYPPSARINDHPGEAGVTPRHTWEMKNAKPHPPRGED